ncbi:MAG: hypothetical protein K5675_08605, partial [Lachnospiraceae bacterium]|nr:hypothetical protein [Lachnospiraceae bacterium]
MENKKIYFKKIWIWVVITILFGFSFASSHYTGEFDGRIFSKGWSEEWPLSDLITTEGETSFDVTTGIVTVEGVGVLHFAKGINGKSKRYLHIKIKNLSAKDQTFSVIGYDELGNQVMGKGFTISEGTMVVPIDKVKMATVDILFPEDGNVSFELAGITLYKRYDGLQNYIFYIAAGILIFVSVCFILLGFILGKELPIFDGILDLFSKRLQNQKWPLAGTALIFFAFLDMFFQRWYLDIKTLGIQSILLLGAAIL